MGDLLDVEVVVPFIVFMSIVAVVAIPFYFRHKKTVLIHQTIKTVVEKTGQADPQLINAIAAGNVGPNADLRKGVVLLAVAGGLAGLGLFIGEQDAIGPLMGAAFFPGLIGLAYIIFHFFAPREPTV